MKRVLLLVIALRAACGQAQLLTLGATGFTVEAGVHLTVQGAVHATPGTTVDNLGTIGLSGDLTNDSGSELFTAAPGQVIMNGGAQQIAGSSVTQFDALDLQCTTLTLQQDAVVGGQYAGASGVLQLRDAIVHLNTHRLTVSNAAPTAIVRTTGHVVSETDPLAGPGEVEWSVGANTGVYSVPFGTGTTYLPVTLAIAAAGSAGGGFVCSTYPTDPTAMPNNRPLPPGLAVLTDVVGVENAPHTLDRFWSVTPTAYAVAPSATLTFTYRDSEWNTGTNLIAEGALQAQYFNGVNWSGPPTGVANTVQNTVTTAITGAYGTVWALAQSSTPLPVELLHFDAVPDGARVLCTWATATESGNDRFTVERSADGAAFADIGEVDGAGEAQHTIQYLFPDEAPLPGLSYYRLRQTDFDGSEHWSAMVAVHFEPVIGALTVFPNPCTTDLFVAGGMGSGTVKVLDATGRVVLTAPAATSVTVSDLPGGSYLLVLEGPGGVRTARFVKQ